MPGSVVFWHPVYAYLCTQSSVSLLETPSEGARMVVSIASLIQ